MEPHGKEWKIELTSLINHYQQKPTAQDFAKTTKKTFSQNQMKLNLSSPNDPINAQTEDTIARVTQDNNLDGSVKLTIHIDRRIKLPDQTISLGHWEKFEATYEDVNKMTILASKTWLPSDDKRQSLAEKIASDPLSATEAILEAYSEILKSAQQAIKIRNTRIEDAQFDLEN